MRLVVDLTLHTPERGGRQTSIARDYSPDWRTGASTPGGSDMHAARVEWLAVETLRPGERAEAVLVTLWPDGRGWTHLVPGDPVGALEGSREVGTATVVRLDVEPATE